MNKILIVTMGAVAVSLSAPCTNADEAFKLNAEQMESITAAGAGNLTFNFSFGRDGFIFRDQRKEVINLQTQSGGIITSTIQTNSFGYRGFATSIQRRGGFQTSFTKN